MSLTEARLYSLTHELLWLRSEIAFFRDTVRTVGIGIQSPAVHERELLRTTALVKARLDTLRPRLEAVAAQIPELSRATHRGGSTSAFGHLGNIRGTLPIVRRELELLETELRSVHGAVLAVMNDPLRTPSVPSGTLLELLDMALTLTHMVLERMRSSRK